MIKKLALVLALLMFSSPAYAQKDHPIYNFKIPKPKFCKNIYNTLKYELQRLNRDMISDAGDKQRDPRVIRVAHLSTIYKNLCNNYNVTRS